jgi:signal transduction histidine kinase
MTEESPGLGIVFLCDTQGRLRRIIRDDLSLGTLLTPGGMFTSRIARHELQEALNFLMDIKENSAVFGRRLTVETGERRVSLLFSGTNLKDGILIQAVPLRIGDANLEQDEVLNEFTRLNNELSNMQRSLAKQNAELNRLNDLKNEFLGMAAHDLKGSLWAVELSSKVLLKAASSDLDPELLDYLNTISATTESLQKIVGEYLDISIIESGKLTLRLQPTELEPLLERSIQLNRILAESRNITITLLSETSLPALKMDPEKMLQVMNNLIENAVKYSQPGSRIKVHVPPPSPADVVFSVEDQGKGIAAEELEHIFEPFGRARKSGRRREKGAGLGLAIAKKVVEAHGGTLSLASHPGQGSVFSVTLPLEPKTFPNSA